MKQGDTLDLKANYLEYNGDTKLVFASGNVILNEPESELYTETLYFDRNKQEAFYNEKGKLIRTLTDTIFSERGTFFANEKKYRFEKNVDLRTPKYNIYSDILNYFTETGNHIFQDPLILSPMTQKYIVKLGIMTQLMIMDTLLKIQKLISKNTKLTVTVFTLINQQIMHLQLITLKFLIQ